MTLREMMNSVILLILLLLLFSLAGSYITGWLLPCIVKLGLFILEKVQYGKSCEIDLNLRVWCFHGKPKESVLKIQWLNFPKLIRLLICHDTYSKCVFPVVGIG